MAPWRFETIRSAENGPITPNSDSTCFKNQAKLAVIEFIVTIICALGSELLPGCLVVVFFRRATPLVL